MLNVARQAALTHHTFMKHEHKQRGYLLPKGCKDLMDVLKPKIKQQPKPAITTIQLPPIIGELTLAGDVTVGELAATLKQKPAKVIASCREFGLFVDRHTMVPHELVTAVIRLYGFTAKKAA
jgi:hypothetical protein